RAMLRTMPAPTGSGTCTNTIGTSRVTCCNAYMLAPLARMTSGASATNSAAYLRKSSASPAPQRYSIRTLRPTVQPNSCRPCRNAALRACPSASSAARFTSTPIRRIRSPCCARAASGHTTAAPPSSVMKSRASSLDHLVGEQLQRVGHLDAEQSRRLQVDDELELGRLQDRQVCGLCALKDLTGVDADLTKRV